MFQPCPFNKRAAIECFFREDLKESQIDVGTGRDGEDANDTALTDKTNGPIYQVSWVWAVQHR